MGVELNIAVIPVLLLLFTSTSKAQSAVFNVVAKYGAKANEKTDLSQPLLDAWKEDCASTTPAKILIPKMTYLLSQAMLEGPSKGPIELQVQGTVKAPADPSAFKKPDWLYLTRLNSLQCLVVEFLMANEPLFGARVVLKANIMPHFPL
ncbi:hypothetical protein REPUB_Repub12eG0028100 [Reevesia pubescens]